MPRVEDIVAKWGKAKFYTTLDLRSGYHHIAFDKDSIKKTAFVASFGKYEYLKVPFGLAYAPAHFQNLMNKVLNGLHFTPAYFEGFYNIQWNCWTVFETFKLFWPDWNKQILN